MVAYKGLDGLVLCVIEGKIDVERWISSIDMLDHSVINYDEIVDSVNNLLNGGLITCKTINSYCPKRRKKFCVAVGVWDVSNGSWLFKNVFNRLHTTKQKAEHLAYRVKNTMPLCKSIKK